jgi:hypothetical protein
MLLYLANPNEWLSVFLYDISSSLIFLTYKTLLATFGPGRYFAFSKL